MLSLDALLASAQRQVAEKAAAKAAKAAKAKPARPADREAANAAAALLREQARWTPVAVVLRVEQWTCACGCAGDSTPALFVLHDHVQQANTTRLEALRPGAAVPPYPKRLLLAPVHVPVCRECGPRIGYIPRSAPAAPRALGSFSREWLQRRTPKEA